MVDSTRLIAAAIVLGVAVIYGLIQGIAFRRSTLTDESVRAWLLNFEVGSVVYGIAWGLAAAALYQTADTEAQVVLVVMMAGLAAAALTTHATLPRSMHLFHVLSLMPLIGAMLLEGSRRSIALAGLCAVLLGVLAVVGRRASEQFGTMLNLQVTNESLLRRIEVAHSELEEAYAELENSNQQLRSAKDRAVGESEAKSQLVAHISHEIRTPLSGIMGITQVLLHDESDPERKKSLDILNDSGRLLLRIVNEVLDLSRAESANLQLEETPFRVVELVERVVNLYRPQAETKAVTLHGDVDSDVPSYVAGDPVRITQILNNLVSNAIKFTETGGVTVRCSCLQADQGSASIRFAVIDTGIGLPEAASERIFEPFVQQSASTAREFGGTGLGLAICARLAKAMGGVMELETELGSGSTFSLTLRLPIVARPPSLVRIQAVSRPPARPSNDAASRVLVVEDDDMLQHVFGRLLRRLGYEYHIAVNGKEAVDLCRTDDFDIVLMDFRMPVMNGPEATRQIRKYGSRVPIIGLTGALLEAERVECMAAGMNDVLAKPVTPHELQQALASWSDENRTAV